MDIIPRIVKTKNKVLPGIVLILGFAFLSIAPASGQIQDFQSRASFELAMDLTKNLEGSLEIGQRFKNNSLAYDRSLLTAAVKYDLPKGFSLGAGARYLLVQNNDHILESRYRVHGDVNYRWKISSFQIRLRDRIQYGFDDIISYATYGNKLTNRSRLGLQYDIFGTPLSAFSSFEVYLVLNDPIWAAYSLNKVMAGMSWDLPKKLNLKMYYLLEAEINRTYPQQAHIIVAALGLKL